MYKSKTIIYLFDKINIVVIGMIELINKLNDDTILIIPNNIKEETLKNIRKLTKNIEFLCFLI